MVGDCVCDGGGEEDREARLKIGSGSRAAVEHGRTNGVENLGVGSLGLFCPFCPRHPPLFPAGAGLRCGRRLILVFSPVFYLPGCTAELLLGNNLCFLSVPEGRETESCFRSLNQHCKEQGEGGRPGDYFCALR